MRWLAFAGWVVVGALGALTAVGIFSIGIFVAPFFIAAGAVAARRTRYPLDALGLVAGLGVPCLVVASVNRDSHPCLNDTTASCGGFDPHPWLTIGLTFVVIGVGAYIVLRLLGLVVPCRRIAK